MKIDFKSKVRSSRFICEDYIAAKVVFDKDSKDYRHVMLSYSNTDALEFGLNRSSGLLEKFVLILCKHFYVSENKLVLPKAPNGDIYLAMPKVTSCNLFKSTIYANGMHILLSSNKTNELNACGNVIIGFDSNKNITELYLTHLSANEREHILKELRYDVDADE